MFGDFKKKLAGVRAQGAFALADTALASGDEVTAIRLYASQARDLSHRRQDSALVRRGWTGVVKTAAQKPGIVPPGGRQEVRDGVDALAETDPDLVRQAGLTYELCRPLLKQLLIADPQCGAVLARLLDKPDEADPRPHYVLGRCLEGDAQRLGEAAEAYRAALADATELRALRRWGAVVTVRLAGVLFALGSQGRLELKDEAVALAESLSTTELRAQRPALQLTAVPVLLASGRSMVRLRALDILVELSRDQAFASRVLDLTQRYLESLGWSYYPTELDRLDEVVSMAARRLGPRVVDDVQSHLGLLRDLHRLGDRPVDRDHLAVLERVTGSQPLMAAADARIEGGALPPPSVACRRDDPRAVGLVALQLSDASTTDEFRAWLTSCRSGSMRSRQAQKAVALGLPALLERWPELTAAGVDPVPVVRRFLSTAAAPSFGFSTLGLGLAHVGQLDLAGEAAKRAVAADEQAPLSLLLKHLAARALADGHNDVAVGWLTAVATPPEDGAG